MYINEPSKNAVRRNKRDNGSQRPLNLQWYCNKPDCRSVDVDEHYCLIFRLRASVFPQTAIVLTGSAEISQILGFLGVDCEPNMQDGGTVQNTPDRAA